MLSPLCFVKFARNLEFSMQFPDSDNAQCNLEIARIPRLWVYIVSFTGYASGSTVDSGC